MINGKGRLQRLNRALRGPGQARDDWEILRDLNQALSGGNGIYTIEDVFREMSEAVPEFAGLTLSRISDLGVQVLTENHGPRLKCTGEPPRASAAASRKSVRGDREHSGETSTTLGCEVSPIARVPGRH